MLRKRQEEGPEVLEPVGLDESTERAYRLLLRHESVTAGGLAEHLEIRPARARQVLDELVATGLATGQPGRPARYCPVDPRTGLVRLVRARQAELEGVVTSMDAYAAEYHERRLRTDPRLLVEVVEGPAEIARRVRELTVSAEHEVLAFDAPPYVTPDRSASDAERAVLAQGVSVRAVYASEVLTVPWLAERLRDLVGEGEQARVLPKVPMKMVVVDGREAVLPLTASEEGTRTTAAFVRRSRLCDALVELFEAHWAQATPIFAVPTTDTSGSSGAAPHPEISETDRVLLQLLNAGLKDEAIARQMDMSDRTLRRKIADLVKRLEATSRFQAGTQAMRRGWL
jgi:sugar-specific transcriptional regulator TrmB/DNA-binding CsgD family transcriptional regulator